MNRYCLGCKSNNEMEIFSIADNDNLVLKCKSCDAIFNQVEISNTIFKTTDESKITLSNKLRHKAIGLTGKLGAAHCIDYLKLHTDMNFKSALDVGCGYGYLVKELRENDIVTLGIESRETPLRYAVTGHNIKGFFDENYIMTVKFDMICLTQMIYYNRKNYELLDHVHSLLNKNGLLFITTTNTNSPILNNMKTQIPNIGTNLSLSKKNYENLKGFELLDYTCFRSNFSVDFHSSKNKYLTFIKYFFNMKKAIVEDPNGNYAYVLLRKKEK